MELWIWLSGLLALLAGGIAVAGFTTERVPMRIAALAAVVGGAAGLLWLILLGVSRRESIYAEYLDDCVAHRPKYECALLWRASESRSASGDPVIVPVPMPR